MRDLKNNVKSLEGVAFTRVSDNTAQVGAIIDMQGYNSLTYLIAAGTLVDAAFTIAALLEESDDSGLAGSNAVADADLIGTEAEAGFDQDDDNTVKKLGYRGHKRYVRLTLTPSDNMGNADFGAIAVQGHPNVAPEA